MEVNLTKVDSRISIGVTKGSTEEQLLGSVQRAETASDECAILYDLFDNRFLGAKSSVPTLDNDGNAIQVGAMYYNSTTLVTHIWNGIGWDTTEAPAFTRYIPQVTAPTHTDGQVFYSDITGTLDVQGKYSDVTLQTGREMHLEITNATASIIPNGSPVTQIGVLDGRPIVKLAIADTFDNARIIGIATHDIAIGSTGIITTFGEVGGLNSLGVTTGVPLYLSSTVAGTFVETPPDIISRIGGMMVSSEADGRLFVLIINNKNLPSVFGGIQGQTGTGLYSVTTTAQDIINYASTKEVVVTVNALTGEITSANSGEYRMHFAASIAFVSSTSTRSITIELYDVTGTAIIFSFVKNIPRDAIEDGLSFSYPIDQAENNVDKLRIKSSTAIDITFSAISFDMESVNIR